MSGSEGNRAEEALRKRFKAEEQQAIDALARWIGHPAVQGIIERRRVGAETVVKPIARLLTDSPDLAWPDSAAGCSRAATRTRPAVAQRAE